MLSKKNSKWLWIVFIVLLAIWLIMKYTDRSNSTLKESLINADTARIDRIEISTSGKQMLSLIRNGKAWKVKSKQGQYKADIRKIRSLLAAVHSAKPISEVSNSEKDWSKYQVNDSLGTQIKLYAGSKTKGDLMVGSSAYIPAQNAAQQPYAGRARGEMVSYVRSADDKNTYTVPGMWRMAFSVKTDDYRSRELFRMDKNKINQIQFSYPNGQKFKLLKEGKQWKLDGKLTDSTQTVQYLSRLAYAYGSQFINDFDAKGQNPAYQIEVDEGQRSPVHLQVFTDSAGRKIFHTSTNEGYFDASKGDLFKRYFVDKAWFFKHK
jgi:hypothetical protein